jgi:hypothetical protein
MSDPTTTTAAQLAALREQVRQVLPAVQSDVALRRALLHAQSAVEARLGLPAEPSHGRTRQR